MEVTRIYLELSWGKSCVMYGHDTYIDSDNNNNNNNNNNSNNNDDDDNNDNNNNNNNNNDNNSNNNNRETTFKITNTKLYVPIVTLSTKDNVHFKKKKQLNEGFKKPVYWNKYKTKIERRYLDESNPTRFCLDATFQEVKRLFALAFDNTDNDANKVKETVIGNILFQE